MQFRSVFMRGRWLRRIISGIEFPEIFVECDQLCDFGTETIALEAAQVPFALEPVPAARFVAGVVEEAIPRRPGEARVVLG